MIKVAIVEDISRLAEMLSEKLQLSGSIQVEWIARNGKDAIAQLGKNSAVDVLLMDIKMPILNGIEATREICRKWPQVKVVMSTVFDDEENIFASILAGACGYLLKDESPESLHQYMEEVMQGGAPMSPGIASKTLQLLRSGKPSRTITQDYGISAREREILEHLSGGCTYEQIAEKLFISFGTVRKHIENIYRKLQVNNKMEAVQKAGENNLLNNPKGGR